MIGAFEAGTVTFAVDNKSGTKGISLLPFTMQAKEKTDLRNGHHEYLLFHIRQPKMLKSPNILGCHNRSLRRLVRLPEWWRRYRGLGTLNPIPVLSPFPPFFLQRLRSWWRSCDLRRHFHLAKNFAGGRIWYCSRRDEDTILAYRPRICIRYLLLRRKVRAWTKSNGECAGVR